MKEVRFVETGEGGIKPFGEKPEEIEMVKSNLVQLAWAERSCARYSGEESKRMIAQTVEARSEWFRKYVLEDEENKRLILYNFPHKNKEILDFLDDMWADTVTLH